MHAHKREQVIKGRGTVGKTAVVGAKDRRTNRVTAAVIDNTDQQTLQGFVAEHVVDGAKVYTDDHRGYDGLPNHETVRHSVAEYVNGMAHTNGIESFWATLKRAHKGSVSRDVPSSACSRLDDSGIVERDPPKVLLPRRVIPTDEAVTRPKTTR